jgi:hypothetical protein
MTKYEKRRFWSRWGMAIKLYAIMIGFALMASMDEIIRRLA